LLTQQRLEIVRICVPVTADAISLQDVPVIVVIKRLIALSEFVLFLVLGAIMHLPLMLRTILRNALIEVTATEKPVTVVVWMGSPVLLANV
jgi:uncharacterized membrane protein